MTQNVLIGKISQIQEAEEEIEKKIKIEELRLDWMKRTSEEVYKINKN